MSDKLTKISPSLLPLRDLQEIMRHQFEFITKEDNATDVNSVAGAPAATVAIAVNPESRSTVLNALMLGGKAAEEYLTLDDGGHIRSNYANIQKVYSSEVQNLRDELYQLRSDLVRKGIVPHYQSYAGYQDVFRNNDPVHQVAPITTISYDSTIRDEARINEYAFTDLDVTDYIVLHLRDVNRFHVAQITHKMPDGETIKFAPSTAFDLMGGFVDVYKSLGMADNGSFAFMDETTMLAASKENHSVLNDDTHRQRRNINQPNRGFGYTFRIPNSMEGFLVRLSLKVTRIGTPGALMAYVINEKDIPRFKNPQQAEADGILLGKSSPAYPEHEQIESILDFEFFNGLSYPLLLNDDTLDNKTRFCMIIEAVGQVDAQNNYRLMFLQSEHPHTGILGDLQLNNTTFEYSRRDANSSETALITNATINNADLYYGIVTRAVINRGITPYREGVYTSRVKLTEPVSMSRARLTLRVNREGYFLSNNLENSSIQNGNNLPIKKHPVLGNAYDMLELRGIGAKNHDDNIVIGTNIRKITGQNADSIQLEKGIFLEDTEVPVYRVGYKVFLKAIRKEYNTNFNVYEEKERVKIELPLTSVMPDRIKKSEKISDRLLFEGEFTNNDPEQTAKYFNEFELQIYWKTEYGQQFEDDKYKNDFLGRIHDLSLAFDKSI